MGEAKVRHHRSAVTDRQRHHEVLVLAGNEKRQLFALEDLPERSPRRMPQEVGVDGGGLLPLTGDLCRVPPLGVVPHPEIAEAARARQDVFFRSRHIPSAPQYILSADR